MEQCQICKRPGSFIINGMCQICMFQKNHKDDHKNGHIAPDRISVLQQQVDEYKIALEIEKLVTEEAVRICSTLKSIGLNAKVENIINSARSRVLKKMESSNAKAEP